MNIILSETQNIIDATKEQIFLQGKTHTGNHAKPRRGQVFYCHLGVGVGSEFQITHTQKNYPVFVPITDKQKWLYYNYSKSRSRVGRLFQ